jgi:putative oxidoreductase
MRGIKKFFANIGRMMLSVIFILSAISKIIEWEKTQTTLINVFCDWQAYVGSFPSLSKMFSTLIAWVPEILIIFTIIELVAAILVFLGMKEKIGVFFLILLFIPSTIILHPFWFCTGVKRSMQLVIFLKNLSILGGLFLFMVFGSKMKEGMMFSSRSKSEEAHEE